MLGVSGWAGSIVHHKPIEHSRSRRFRASSVVTLWASGCALGERGLPQLRSVHRSITQHTEYSGSRCAVWTNVPLLTHCVWPRPPQSAIIANSSALIGLTLASICSKPSRQQVHLWFQDFRQFRDKPSASPKQQTSVSVCVCVCLCVSVRVCVCVCV